MTKVRRSKVTIINHTQLPLVDRPLQLLLWREPSSTKAASSLAAKVPLGLEENGRNEKYKVCFDADLHKVSCVTNTTGFKRQQETYISQLRELQKSKPRGQIEENLSAEMSRLESALTLARDDLVSLLPTIFNIIPNAATS
jgi:hypothetical protein